MKIVGIVGSIAEKSYNRDLLYFIKRHYSDLFDLDIVEIDKVPMFNQDQGDLTTSGVIHTINRKILQADGVIISTPEHNHTIPAPLNSLLEWLSFKIHPLKNKPVAIVGASYLDQGTSRAQLHLRQILEAPGIDALVMPGSEFLLGDCKEAFDENGNLKDKQTINFLRNVLEKFVKYVEAVQVLKVEPHMEAEDLTASNPSDTTIEGIDKSDPNWVEKAAEKVGAVSGDTYVKLDRGLLTVNQLNWFLKTIPLELTYADENNQYLYYNHNQDGDNMFASRYPEQVGESLGALHPPHTYKNVAWVISQLRSGNLPGVHVHVPIHKDNYVVHNYVAMHDEEGKYRGINEFVLDLQPVIDWYLEQTGQRLVGAPDANSSASVGGAWGTSEDTDGDSSASESTDTNTNASASDGGSSATDDDSGASYNVDEPDTASGASE